MNTFREKAVLHQVETVRAYSDALIVVGIMTDGPYFYSVDDRLAIPDLRQILEDNVAAICKSVARERARKAKEGAVR